MTITMGSAKMTNMFSYGIFTEDSIRQSVFLREVKTRGDAVLHNFKRHEYFNHVYPKRNSVVTGILLEDLTDEEVEILDAIENGYNKGKALISVGDKKVEAIFYFKTREDSPWWKGR